MAYSSSAPEPLHIGLGTGLSGSSHGANERHWLVRDRFLTRFLPSKKVRALLAGWEAHTGLGAHADAMRATLVALADAVGVASPSALFGGGSLRPRDAARALQARAAYADAYQQFCAATEANHRYIWDSAWEFMAAFDELRVYDWLAQELVMWFEECLYARVAGRAPVLRRDPERLATPAPPVEFQFVPGPDESAEDALRRYTQEEGAYRAYLERAILPAGRDLERDRKALEQRADWLFRYAVLRQSVRSIAKKDFGDPDRRKDVYDGIKRIKDLFALAGPLHPVLAPQDTAAREP